MVTYSTQCEYTWIGNGEVENNPFLKESTRELKVMEFINEWICYKNSSSRSNNSSNNKTSTINNNNNKV